MMNGCGFDSHHPSQFNMSSQPTVKNLFANQTQVPIVEPTPKSLFPAVSGVYVVPQDTFVVKSILASVQPKGEKPTGPKSLLSGAKVRNRIEATIEQLRKYNEPDNVLKIAQQQIRETNTDELCLKYVLDWGADLQKEHADSLEKMMTISTSPFLSSVKTTMGILVQAMGEIDVADATKDSLFRSKEKKVAKLMAVLNQLKSDADRLLTTSQLVMDLHTLSGQLKKTFIDLGSKINPFIVTCSFFSEYEKDNFPKELYITRLSSLLSTKLSVGNDVKTMETISQTIVNIVDVINNILRNELPTWISNLNAVLAGNVADLSTVQTTQTKIANKLKSIL